MIKHPIILKEFSFYNRLIKYQLWEEEIVNKNFFQSIIEFQKFYKLLFNNEFSTEEQLDIIRKHPCYIIYMINCKSEVQEEAIRYNCNVIQLIREQSDHIKNIAINKGCLLEYIINPTLEMRRKAVQINSINILYIIQPSNDLLDIVLIKNEQYKIKQEVKINFYHDSKDLLKALDDRQYYLLKEDKNNKNCTIS